MINRNGLSLAKKDKSITSLKRLRKTNGIRGVRKEPGI